MYHFRATSHKTTQSHYMYMYDQYKPNLRSTKPFGWRSLYVKEQESQVKTVCARDSFIGQLTTLITGSSSYIPHKCLQCKTGCDIIYPWDYSSNLVYTQGEWFLDSLPNWQKTQTLDKNWVYFATRADDDDKLLSKVKKFTSPLWASMHAVSGSWIFCTRLVPKTWLNNHWLPTKDVFTNCNQDNTKLLTTMKISKMCWSVLKTCPWSAKG